MHEMSIVEGVLRVIEEAGQRRQSLARWSRRTSWCAAPEATGSPSASRAAWPCAAPQRLKSRGSSAATSSGGRPSTICARGKGAGGAISAASPAPARRR